MDDEQERILYGELLNDANDYLDRSGRSVNDFIDELKSDLGYID